MKYVAFLRGINLGSTHKVPMGELKLVFERLGFIDVKTLLNSGNVVFSSDETDTLNLKTKIEEELFKKFGFEIGTLIRTQKDIQEMVSNNLFKDITVISQTRLYITFLSKEPTNSLKIPYESPEKNFKILQISNNAIFSVLQLSEKYNTTDAMKVLEEEFGKNVTTRNWNTVVKLANL